MNNMEHIIITELGNGLLRLKPEDGYRLYNIVCQAYFSEAVIKAEDLRNFKAIAIV